MNTKEKLDALNRGETLEKIGGALRVKYYRIRNSKLKYCGDFDGNYNDSGSYSNLLDYDFRISTGQKTIIIDGKEIEISEESYNELKRSLT